MSIFEVIFLLVATAVFTLCLASRNPRGALWMLLIALDVVLSDAYATAGLPYPEAAMAGLDFLVCISIYLVARQRWELAVFITMQLSMLISLIYLGSGIAGPSWIGTETYLTVLEAINYMAAFIIGVTGGYAFVDRADGFAFRRWRGLRPAGLPLFDNDAKDHW